LRETCRAIDIRLRFLPSNGEVVALALSGTYECANEACGLALRYNPLDFSHLVVSEKRSSASTRRPFSPPSLPRTL
jgi:hypothetical protein